MFWENGEDRMYLKGDGAYGIAFRVNNGNRIEINKTTGDVTMQGASGRNFNWDNSEASLYLTDSGSGASARLKIGSGGDLQLYHDVGGANHITCATNQELKISANQLTFYEYSGVTKRFEIDASGHTTFKRSLNLDSGSDNHHVKEGRSWTWTSNGFSNGNVRGYIYADSSNHLRIGTNGWNEKVRITSDGDILGKVIHGKLSLSSTTSGSGQNWSSYIQSPYGGITASVVTSYNDLLIGQNIRGHLACLDGSTTNSYYHWVTHGSMGYAGIEFKYGGLTRFYNWSGSSTANATFTPTVAIGIDNQGDHWGGENPDSTMWDATNQNGWYYRRAQGSFAIATKSSVGYSNIYLNKNTGAGTSDNRWIGFYWDTTTIGAITRNSNNTVSYGGTSDYRLKKDDVEIADGITRVKQLRPIKFKWKSNNIEDEGFFAHETQSIVPYAVTGTKDQVITDEEVAAGTARDGKPAGTPIYQNIDYGQLTPILTAALKEAIAKIEVLEAKVAALEGS